MKKFTLVVGFAAILAGLLAISVSHQDPPAQPQYSSEICDGVDNDGNGQTDEGGTCMPCTMPEILSLGHEGVGKKTLHIKSQGSGGNYEQYKCETHDGSEKLLNGFKGSEYSFEVLAPAGKVISVAITNSNGLSFGSHVLINLATEEHGQRCALRAVTFVGTGATERFLVDTTGASPDGMTIQAIWNN